MVHGVLYPLTEVVLKYQKLKKNLRNSEIRAFVFSVLEHSLQNNLKELESLLLSRHEVYLKKFLELGFIHSAGKRNYFDQCFISIIMEIHMQNDLRRLLLENVFEGKKFPKKLTFSIRIYEFKSKQFTNPVISKNHTEETVKNLYGIDENLGITAEFNLSENIFKYLLTL